MSFLEHERTWTHGHAEPLDPMCAFLLNSLILRPTLLQRNGAPFVTLRRWRAGMKPHQIEALRQIKRDPGARFVNAVADDILAHLDTMLGGRVYQFVSPIPCSRSLPDACLPTLLAEKLAARLGLTFVAALEIDRAEGKSHPKRNPTRPAMRLAAPPRGATILVDDVATSGAHMEEATRLLLPEAKAVFALAWIGGAPG